MKVSGHTPRNEEEEQYLDEHNEKETKSQN